MLRTSVPLFVLPLTAGDPPLALDPLGATGSGSPPGPRVKLSPLPRKLTILTAPVPARYSLRGQYVAGPLTMPNSML